MVCGVAFAKRRREGERVRERKRKREGNDRERESKTHRKTMESLRKPEKTLKTQKPPENLEI